MIFQHTIDKVLNRTKTRTSRIQKPGEVLFLPIVSQPGTWVYHNGRTKWAVGDSIAVQPGRGKKQVARIKLLDITDRDVRSYSQAEIAAEGFPTMADFLMTWAAMHDTETFGKIFDTGLLIDEWLHDYCTKMRPANLYTAWALDFELETT